MTRVLNEAGMVLISAFEGVRLVAYRDVSGTWTIGYGHTADVFEGDTITSDQAMQLLGQDLASFRSVVDGATNGKATDNQFAAMVSLTYNIGQTAFKSSSVLRLHNGGEPAKAAAAFLLWDKAHVDGRLVVINGLLRRREAERDLYNMP